MRLLAHGPSLAAHPRMARAAVALALRGHQVTWAGAPGPEPAPGVLPGGLERVPGGWAAARTAAEVVLGGASAVRAAVIAGRLARARCAVLAFEGDEPERWSLLDRLAWGSFYGSGLVDAAGAERLARQAGLVALERIGLWPDGAPAAEPGADSPDAEILERACERALARHHGPALRPGVFLDRDGTLVIERGYLSDPADLELLPGVPQALLNLRAAGHPVIVISNQSGVGRGMFTLARVYEAMAMLRHQLRRHGVELDAIYFCPHRPEDRCTCRKPATGLLERAAEDLQLDLAGSAVIGDKLLDVETGRRAGALGILVRTGYGGEEEARAAAGAAAAVPDHVAAGLDAAVAWLLEREGLGSI